MDIRDRKAYSYLLGMYLGDGWIESYGPYRRSAGLRISCDSQYQSIAADVVHAMRTVSGHPKVGLYRSVHSRGVEISSYWKGWFELFPQHGPGRKHLRPIVLARWQREVVEEHPWAFLNGLLHSDGCRSINRVKTTLPSGRYAKYEYPRWYFVNASEDILGLFAWACDLVGVRATRSRERMMTVSKRDSVALIDEHVGLKA